MVAHYYSYSFCLNPNWSHKYPLQPEILAYFENVAAKYDIGKHVKLGSVVQSAHWDGSSGTWLVSIKELATSETYNRRCKILISAVGVLSIPNECQIPGASTFQGPLFHTARWDHSFEWKDKELVVIGSYPSTLLSSRRYGAYYHVVNTRGVLMVFLFFFNSRDSCLPKKLT